MPLGVGASGFMSAGRETTFNTPATPTDVIGLVSETVQDQEEKLPHQAVLGAREINNMSLGVRDIQGPFTYEANPDNLGLILWAALGVEAAPVQVPTTLAYDHDFTPAQNDVDLGSLTLEIDRGLGTSDVFTYGGCVVNSWGMTAQKGSLVNVDVEVFGASELDEQTRTALTIPTLLPYTFSMGNLAIDTVDVAFCNQFSMSIVNNLDTDGGFVLDNSRERNHIYKTTLEISGSMEFEWTALSDAERDAFRDNDTKQLTLTVTSTEEVDTGLYYSMTIDIPKCKYTAAFPNITGRDRVPFTVDWMAIYDATNTIKVTLRDARTTKWGV